MGRKHREAMAAARASLDARYQERGTLERPCQALGALTMGRCEVPTRKTVVFPGSKPIPACSLMCATKLAGPENFDVARWG